MKRLLVATALLIFCVPLHAAEEPISPKPDQTELQEPHWQLFLDDHVIARSTGFQRVVHHPQPRGVVLKPDKPWESMGAGICRLAKGRLTGVLLRCTVVGHQTGRAITARIRSPALQKPHCVCHQQGWHSLGETHVKSGRRPGRTN